MPKHSPSAELDALQFDNRFIRELPGDPEENNHRRSVLNACYSRVLPTPVRAPQLVAYAAEVAELLGLSTATCHSDHFLQVFAGNQLSRGMEPYATCYGGHQFGQWAGQLGDGRAINLGEVINAQGQRLALQLKGAGPTPYSRHADGLAVLRSSVREFLCSEAMFHLQVPTTRALSLVITGEPVVRDMFYNGNPQLEPGAVVCRVAPSFTRFGHFQILTAQRNYALLQQLVDYTIRTDFPQLGAPSPDVYLEWFKEVCRRTALMIVHWQRVGFVHGVMNTDNMSILGLTIDYGPYGWLENYDPNWTPNTTDAAEHRYCYGRQAQIAHWNLGQLANAIYPLIDAVEPLQAAMAMYNDTFVQHWQSMMVNKLGLASFQAPTDEILCTELLQLLTLVETDMTLFYRRLAEVDMTQDWSSSEQWWQSLLPAYYVAAELTPSYKSQLVAWLKRYQRRLQQAGVSEQERRSRMQHINPIYVLRNYLAQQAIDQAHEGDFTRIQTLLQVLRQPYTEQPQYADFAAKRPEWARQRPGCSMLSCSS